MLTARGSTNVSNKQKINLSSAAQVLSFKKNKLSLYIKCMMMTPVANKASAHAPFLLRSASSVCACVARDKKEKMKLIVRPESADLWWGIYGLTEKIGWEDLNIFNENGEQVGCFCLNTKKYLRANLDELKSDPNEVEFSQAVENYLNDNKFHYWYYYNKKGDVDIYEVPYESAPKNGEGVKPRFIDIWHPDENIGMSTIKSAVKEFGERFLNQEITNIEIENTDTFEELIKSFEENEKLFAAGNPVKISFSDELIDELSHHWEMSKDDVLLKLKKGIE